MTATPALRPMTEEDLALLERWLHQPHFARWFLQDSTIEQELADSRAAIRGEVDCTVLIVEADGQPIGWCQYYPWSAWAQETADYDALPGEIGIDYGIGEPGYLGRGVGTALVAALVARVREVYPGASILVGPSAANEASCGVLRNNGFELVDIRDISSEPNASPLALYRLPG